jgi:hypothetical protein
VLLSRLSPGQWYQVSTDSTHIWWHMAQRARNSNNCDWFALQDRQCTNPQKKTAARFPLLLDVLLEPILSYLNAQ